DFLDVQPTPRLQAVFDAMDDLGFSLRTAECEADPYGRYTTSQRFIQEFEFRANAGPFRDAVDEIELVARPGSDELDLFIEVDRRGGLLSEMAETDERKTSLAIQSTSIDDIRRQLKSTIEQCA
ncbi:MAG: sporulation protein, partial [Halorhabdus sp.]